MLHRARSAVGAAVLLLGLPIVLVRLVGWPLPRRWPDRQQWQQWLDEPLAGNLLIGAVTVVAWLLWAVLVYAALAHLVLWLRRAVRWLARLPRLPLPTPMQGLAGGMLGAVAVTTTTGTASGPPPTTTAVSTPDDVDGTRHDTAAVGVRLPDGGWLPTPVAEAVNAAAALVWWRRRRHYQPRPLTTVQRLDSDLTTLPNTAGVVQAAVADRGQAAVPGDLPLIEDLPTGGVGWTGPGAAAAARGALIALLLGHRLAGRLRVVTTADDLHTLLGSAVGGDVPGLGVAASVADALDILDQFVVDHPGHPVTILTTPPAEARVGRRLAALLTLGAGHGMTGVLLGSWPHGTTWHIYADGTTDTAAARLCTLSDTAAADLIRLAALRTQETSDRAGSAAPVVLAAADQHDAPIRLRLLGGVHVTGNGQPVPITRTAAVQILTYLALHPAGATTGQLTAAVWPHLRPHAAAGSFHTATSHLRKALRAAAGGREVITRTGDRYLIEAGAVQTDVGRLLAAAGQAVTAPTPVERDTALRTLIDQYRGELAAGHHWSWLAPLREAVRRHVIDAYTTLAAAHPPEAARLWQAATGIDPGNEHLHGQAVAALTAAGQHRAVAAVREQHARALAAAGLWTAADQGL